jgi:hypothetical protein
MDKARGVRDGLSDRSPQQHIDTAHDRLNHGKQFLTDEYFPDEQFICRGKKVLWFFFNASSLLIHLPQVIIECQKHDD